MLWVEEGAELWRAGAKPCAVCHGQEGLAAVAARYPAWDADLRRPVSLGERIRRCRVEAQGGAPWAPESRQVLALEAWLGSRSRGRPVAPLVPPEAREWLKRGEALFRQRQGRMNLSCAQCHEERVGRRLGAEPISQGQVNAYPAYRIEWQALGSLHRRLANCYAGLGAEVPAPDSDEDLALQYFLHWRGQGLPVETPGVRR